ncbi:hypothetical protein PIB30_015348 [Stylosanthes scabra]|uniref:Uncharacterized protein n=1 Tax=Stylosanthes scabra TaxID=79078 RepID=A0ABU6R789_9FABA|nr:hypothetical protein [Stylosanthes scabra]
MFSAASISTSSCRLLWDVWHSSCRLFKKTEKFNTQTDTGYKDDKWIRRMSLKLQLRYGNESISMTIRSTKVLNDQARFGQRLNQFTKRNGQASLTTAMSKRQRGSQGLL